MPQIPSDRPPVQSPPLFAREQPQVHPTLQRVLATIRRFRSGQAVDVPITTGEFRSDPPRQDDALMPSSDVEGAYSPTQKLIWVNPYSVALSNEATLGDTLAHELEHRNQQLWLSPEAHALKLSLEQRVPYAMQPSELEAGEAEAAFQDFTGEGAEFRNKMHYRPTLRRFRDDMSKSTIVPEFLQLQALLRALRK